MRIEPIASAQVNDALERGTKNPLPRTSLESATRSLGVAGQPPMPSIPPETTLKVKRQADDMNSTVYQLLDKSGDVVTQLPSEQVLNVADSIEQLLQQEIQTPKLDVKS